MPKVGILSDDRLQQHHIKNTLVQFGFDVLLMSEPSKIKETSDTLCAWIVDYPATTITGWLDDLLDGTVPVLMGIEKAPQKRTLPSRNGKKTAQQAARVYPGPSAPTQPPKH